MFIISVPRPPRNMTIERVTSTSVVVHWEPPTNSIFSAYAIRYRTDSDGTWVRLPPVKDNEAEVADMTPGERYTIQVNTVSFGIESNGPQQVNQTVRPNPVSNIAPLVDSSNVTLEWPRPDGRVEIYLVRWWATGQETDVRERNVTQPPEVPDISPSSSANNVRVLVGDLTPGIEYTFQIRTMSYNLESDVTTLTTRTSKFFVVIFG